jgi:small subunit ribosomal protein S14
MATTAKIAKDTKMRAAIRKRAGKTAKFACRLRNRCWRCGRPRGYLRKLDSLPPVLRQLALNGESWRDWAAPANPDRQGGVK